MEPRKIVLLLVALVIAGGTALLARNVMQTPAQVQQPQAVAAKPIERAVLVAARDLPAGTILKDVDVKWSPLPPNAQPSADLLLKSETQPSAYIGGVIRRGVRAEENVTKDRVVPKGDQGFMAAVLTPGMRAISVPLTPTSGVAGFIFPGDRVDVIVTQKLTSTAKQQPEAPFDGRRVSETFLRDVRVLALDQRADDQAAEPKIAQTATLEVSQKQAESLAVISQAGQIALTLRSQQPSADEPPAIDAKALVDPSADMTWDSDVSQVLPKPANRHGVIQRVQIMRGKDKTESVFDLKQ
jgi:pilus assembly protein CpaB